MSIESNVIQGDCAVALNSFGDDSFDLIVTSPPYADRRISTYGGVKPEQYVEWLPGKMAQSFS